MIRQIALNPKNNIASKLHGYRRLCSGHYAVGSHQTLFQYLDFELWTLFWSQQWIPSRVRVFWISFTRSTQEDTTAAAMGIHTVHNMCSTKHQQWAQTWRTGGVIMCFYFVDIQEPSTKTCLKISQSTVMSPSCADPCLLYTANVKLHFALPWLHYHLAFLAIK